MPAQTPTNRDYYIDQLLSLERQAKKEGIKLNSITKEMERKRCWNEINSLIKQGPLQGNGCDEVATRNGLILAANIILAGLE